MQKASYKRIRKAIFPVGGLGTRFLPATKSMPKEMLPVAKKPLVQHVFEEAKIAGIEQFIFITGRNKNAINNHFDHAFELEKILSEGEKTEALNLTKDWLPEPGNLIFIRQQQPLGLGHAIWCARHLIEDEPFIILLPDELFITDSKQSLAAEMISTYNQEALKGNYINLVAVAPIELSDSYKYGIIKPETLELPSTKIIDMVEKPLPENSPSNLAMVGRYILQPEIFRHISDIISHEKDEIQLTEAMRIMLKYQNYYSYKVSGKRLDCGHYLGFLEANIEFALNDSILSTDARKLIKRISEDRLYKINL